MATDSQVPHDDRWLHGMDGWRVLVWVDYCTRVYGEVTGYDPVKQRFYVVLDDDPSRDPQYVGWEDVRPA